MSEEKDKSTEESNSVFDALERFGHIYALIAIMFTAVLTRIQGFENLRLATGQFAFSGNDAWYHFRTTMYTVKNYPHLIGFDAMTGYPAGSSNGTFGTLFDLVHATVALVLGLGNPSEELVRKVLLFSPPVTMAFVALATYFLGKYLADSKWVGVAAAGFVTLFPGTLYRRTQAGFSEHHAMETLLLVVTVLMIARAMKSAEENLVVWELIKQRDYEELKPWIKSVGLAMLAVFLYYFTWPPSIVLLAFLGITALVYSIVGYSLNRPIEPGVITTTVISVGFLLLVLSRGPTMEPRMTNASILHVFTGVVAILGNVYILVLNRYANSKNWSTVAYASAIFGAGALTLLLAAVIQPSIIDRAVEVLLRLLGNPFGLGREAVLTIGEEQPVSLITLAVSQYGLMLPASIIGVILSFGASVKKANNKEEFIHFLFLSMTFVLILILSARSIRYNYYFAPLVAVFGAFALKKLVDYVGAPDTFGDIKGYHVLLLFIVVFTILPVMFVPFQSAVYSDSIGGVGGYESWQEPLTWLNNNSPEDGIKRYGSYNKQGFQYTNETYGVMSWWDYGHWITVSGDRVPVANPFQQNAKVASKYLLSKNAEQAEQVIENQSENAKVKYVMIDWQMASPLSKYPAIVQFNDNVSIDGTLQPYYTTSSNGRLRLAFYQRSQRFYETMLARLYYGHGSSMEPAPYTVDFETRQTRQGTVRTIDPSTNPVTVHDTVEQARENASKPGVEFGGFGNTNPHERVEALEHYRLVKSSPDSSFRVRSNVIEYARFNASAGQVIDTDFIDTNPSRVKLFQKVDGAEIQGQAQPNRNYTLRVILRDPATNSTFSYTQRVQTTDNGTFNTTVPYSSTGYEKTKYPPQVRATSPYQLINSNGEVVAEFQVSESDVVNESNDTVTVNALTGESNNSSN